MNHFGNVRTAQMLMECFPIPDLNTVRTNGIGSGSGAKSGIIVLLRAILYLLQWRLVKVNILPVLLIIASQARLKAFLFFLVTALASALV